MTAFLAGLGFGALIGLPASVLTTRALCRGCQVCEVCGSGDAYDIDDHLVCEDHEDHDFEIAKLGGRA